MLLLLGNEIIHVARCGVLNVDDVLKIAYELKKKDEDEEADANRQKKPGEKVLEELVGWE